MKRYNTMCEFWTLKQSKNHVMMGSIDAWFYKYLAGIRPVESVPAFSSFRVKPVIPDSLYSAGSTIETLRGTISSKWALEGDKFTLDVEIPFNTTAVISVPGKKEDIVNESGNPVTGSDMIECLGYSENYHTFKVGSGKYHFAIK
jgi:alpha-L-rhamnosidase